MKRLGATAFALSLVCGPCALAQGAPAPASPIVDLASSRKLLEQELVAKCGEAQRARLHRGLEQAGRFWRAEDGDAQAFEAFVRAYFAGDEKALDLLFERLETALESFDGHMVEVGRDFRWHTELDLGPIQPIDELLAAYDPGAHFLDDAFASKLAFVVLLNFPMSTLDERLADGARWTRRQWAEARLVDRFSRRVPASVNQAYAQASAEAERYIASYNVWMHHLVDAQGNRLFPAKLRLLSHWNLRDELKADYSEGAAGLAKQRTILKVMERIVTQEIPACVVDNPFVDWNPWTNDVKPAAVQDSGQPAPPDLKVSSAPEPDTRYRVLLQDFRAVRQADPYSPASPTHIARSFNEDRQIPEARVRRMLEDVLSSPLVPKVAALIKSRLGRGLEPFDVWYNGFVPRGEYTEAQLDAIVRKRYPTPEAYKRDMPNILQKLGFTRERAEYLASHIEVDPARGSGHAMGASRRADHAHLRTRVGQDGMDYKGFNIAIHENGHNVEQTFSLNLVDHTLLQGVPNTAFTEALAFVFQARDLEVLGLAKPSAQARALKTLDDFWMAYEIAGVALVDMGVWDWMYQHPDAAPAELKAATLALCKDVWNRYYAPVLGGKDCVLLGVYSHMIHSFLYLPDYPLGHMIAFQIEQQIEKSGNLGAEFERMARQGRLAPDLWMIQATGRPVGPEALLEATAKALDSVK